MVMAWPGCVVSAILSDIQSLKCSLSSSSPSSAFVVSLTDMVGAEVFALMAMMALRRSGGHFHFMNTMTLGG
jgi:hypothetical protein